MEIELEEREREREREEKLSNIYWPDHHLSMPKSIGKITKEKERREELRESEMMRPRCPCCKNNLTRNFEITA